MLPFLNKKERNQSATIVEMRKPDEGKEQENQGLEACMRDVIKCMDMKDAKGMARAFKDAFDLCESYPHDEYPHEFESDEDTE